MYHCYFHSISMARLLHGGCLLLLFLQTPHLLLTGAGSNQRLIRVISNLLGAVRFTQAKFKTLQAAGEANYHQNPITTSCLGIGKVCLSAIIFLFWLTSPLCIALQKKGLNNILNSPLSIKTWWVNHELRLVNKLLVFRSTPFHRYFFS